MIVRGDLHVHTTASDGRLTPSACVTAAVERGLTALAITDHDTMAGVPEALAAAPPGLLVVPGVEIGATWRMVEVHILGYGCRATDPDLATALAAMRESRERRLERMLVRLAELGLPLEASAVERIADGAVLGRPHVAQAMVDRGYVPSVAEAFAQYLGDGCPAYVDRLRLSCEQALALIRGAGGVAVLAHPGLIHNDNAVHSLIARGIRGLEVHYPQHDVSATAHYASLARRFGLLVTGGSDFHGIPGEGGAIGECGVSETELAALAGAAGIAADTHV